MLNAKRSVRIPTPPPFKNHGNHVVSVAELTRWMAERAEEAGAYLLTETVGAQAAGLRRRRARGPHRRQGPRHGRRREVQLRARRRRRSRVHRARRGRVGPPHGRGDQGARPRRRPATRRCGRSASRRSGRSRKPLTKVIHTLGWPLRTAGKLQGVRRLLDLPDGRGPGLDRLRGRPRPRRRAALGPRRPAGVQAATRRSARSSRAASGWRGARRRSPRAATGRCRGSPRPASRSAATPAAWSTSPSSRASTTGCTRGSSPPSRSCARSRRAARTSSPTTPRCTSR